MTKPTLPTQAEMRANCRMRYGAYSNISREWIKQMMTPEERIALAGYPDVDRNMAETWEEAWFVLDPVEQNVYLDWYIDWYTGSRYKGALLGDPDHQDPLYALGGYLVQRWHAKEVCECMFQVIGDTPGAFPRTWMRTHKTCPEHSGTGQVLRDTVYNEASRKNGVLAIVAALIGLEAKEDRTTWAFSNDRLAGTDERVLELVINGASNPQRASIQGAADTQFGANAIRVS